MDRECTEAHDDVDNSSDSNPNLVTRLSEFSGDLAHEMRTPVATLLGRTQVALSKGRTVWRSSSAYGRIGVEGVGIMADILAWLSQGHGWGCQALIEVKAAMTAAA